jgi:hypothetical protein
MFYFNIIFLMVKLYSCNIYQLCLSNTKVTGVGINTEWGQLMANLSEDNGEETPLQVNLCSGSVYSCMSQY